MNLDPALWLIRPKPNPLAHIRLYCFPYAGGGVPTFRNWINAFPPEYELTVVQLPGRGSFLREKPYTSMNVLIPDLLQVLGSDVNRPCVFFGHSLGALISFEVARAFIQIGIDQPMHLFVSGRSAPHLPDPNKPIYHLPDREFLDQIRQMNGTPQEILDNAELIQIFLPILRADFTLNETYVYQEASRLSCPVTAFGGDQDARVPLKCLDSWRNLTQGRFRSLILPGSHFFLHSKQEELVREILKDIQASFSGAG
jgi:medium-chain acyl-[acyl-carrier-protein] hydrolase